MTDVVQTTSLVVVAQNYAPRIVSQINRRCATLRTLRIEGPMPGVQTPAWVAKKDGQLAANHSETADAADFGSDAQVGATLPWGLYWAPFHSSDLAMSQGAAAAGPEDNVRLWASNLVDASATLASLINVALHASGNSGTLIRGFGTALGADDNTYAGIDRSQSENAFWRPSIFAPGSATPLSLGVLRNDLGTIKDRSGERPDLAYVSTGVMNIMKGLFDPTRYFIQQITTARSPEPIALDNSVQAMRIEGCQFIEEKDAPANSITYVNSNHTVIRVLPKPAPEPIMWQNIPANDGFGNIPMAFAYSKLAKTGATEKAIVDSQVQLEVTRPNSGGMRTNIAA